MTCRPIFPDLKITNGPPKPLYPISKRNLVPILKSDTSRNKENKKKTITSNWEISNREPKSPNNQNLNNFAFDDDLLRINRSPGNSSPKFASSHHGLCTNPVRSFFMIIRGHSLTTWTRWQKSVHVVVECPLRLPHFVGQLACFV